MKTIAGMPVREVLGRECVLVGYDHRRCAARLAADLYPDTYVDLDRVPDPVMDPCHLCPAMHTDDCAGTDCDGGYLVDTKWLPLLLMRMGEQP